MEAQPYGIVYIARHKTNGKVYVGQTIKQLWKRRHGHISGSKLGNGARFGEAIREHGIESFEFREVAQAFSREELGRMERSVVAMNESDNPEFGYNVSPGGHVMSKETARKISAAKKGLPGWFKGKHHTQETKAKLSASKKGRPSPKKGKPCFATRGRKRGPHTAETKAKLSLVNKGNLPPNTGKRHSEATRAKLSEAAKRRPARVGMKHSSETKAKISASHTGYKHTDDSKAIMSSKRIGSDNANSKLIELYIPAVRRAKGILPARAVGELLGVPPAAIYGVWSGKNWKHVPEVAYGC